MNAKKYSKKKQSTVKKINKYIITNITKKVNKIADSCNLPIFFFFFLRCVKGAVVAAVCIYSQSEVV